MKDNVKRAFYVRQVAHPCYLNIIAQRPEIRLDKLENETPEAVAEPIMAAAHAYQIGSARDELPLRFHARRDLLARMPNLLVVPTSGAGFDTVNVKDCTEAGVLVVNQSGGNADAVAAHVLAMMLALSKHLIQSDLPCAAAACTTAGLSPATTCTAAPSASSASAMSAAAWPSSAAGCSPCR